MTKFDFRLDRKDLYAPGRDLAVVTVPPMQYLSVDGAGDPNTSQRYVEAVEALYSLSYAAKFASKLELDRDYVVPPLEGLWWGEGDFASLTKSQWSWTMMIRQPDWLTNEIRDAAHLKAAKKNLPALDAVELRSLDEGLSVQYLHVGSYDDEAPGIARMHAWIAENGYAETTAHHEIYLGDPRRTAPERLKTVIRQPIRPAG